MTLLRYQQNKRFLHISKYYTDDDKKKKKWWTKIEPLWGHIQKVSSFLVVPETELTRGIRLAVTN